MPGFISAADNVALQSGHMRGFAVLCLISCSALSAQKLPFDVQALMKIKRISDPQLSPDGRTAVAALAHYGATVVVYNRTFERAQEFLRVVMPRYVNRLKFYDEKVPLFHKYGIEEEIAKIQRGANQNTEGKKTLRRASRAARPAHPNACAAGDASPVPFGGVRQGAVVGT